MFVSWKKIENARNTAACCSSRERADRLLELRALARLARVACQAADLLLQHEQLLALLLDEDVPEHVAEQADVGAERRVW